MGLRTKFNLILVFAGILGMIATAYFSRNILQKNAEEEVLLMAGVIMEGAKAVRSYTIEEIRPLLAENPSTEFIPQMVPAYAAHNNIRRLQKRYANYSYKEATLNPTNPASRASDWEAEIIKLFRNNQNRKELIGKHDAATGPSLYLARPITIKNAGCLACHGEVSTAPPSLIKKYGTANGFGWKMGETVGAQIVSIPMSIPLQRADRAFKTFMILIAGVFAVIVIVLNVLLSMIVVNPIRNIAKNVEEVSLGKLDTPELKARSKDEIGVLINSVNRLRRSLSNAMKLIDD